VKVPASRFSREQQEPDLKMQYLVQRCKPCTVSPDPSYFTEGLLERRS
jgi:hypothetical protein